MFEDSRKRLTYPSVLELPELEDPFQVLKDLYSVMVGAVLLEKKANGKKHPAHFASRTINSPERNYSVYDVERLAVFSPPKSLACSSFCLKSSSLS